MSTKTTKQQPNKKEEYISDDDEEDLVLNGAKTTDIQEEYTVQAVFGSGGFSTVYTAVDNSNGDVVAIKHIVKYREEPDRMMPWELHKQYLANEVETLLRLSGCPNVVQLYDIYEDAANIFMVFELIDGEELFDMICANGFYPEHEAVLILRAVCRGLKACHDRNVMHRDIKPENIMCPITDKNSHDLTKATIIDFGLAAILETGSFATEASGSPGYVAPEILVGCPYDRAVDMWSLGVTAYILLAGYPPWVEDGEVPVEDQIIAGDYEFHSPEWDDVSDLAKDWIRKLLVLDPTKRMNVAEALQHDFLKMSVQPADIEVEYAKPAKEEKAKAPEKIKPEKQEKDVPVPNKTIPKPVKQEPEKTISAPKQQQQEEKPKPYPVQPSKPEPEEPIKLPPPVPDLPKPEIPNPDLTTKPSPPITVDTPSPKSRSPRATSPRTLITTVLKPKNTLPTESTITTKPSNVNEPIPSSISQPSPPPVNKIVQTKPICTQCGKLVEAKYCGSCGAKLETLTPPSPTPPIVSTPAPKPIIISTHTPTETKRKKYVYNPPDHTAHIPVLREIATKTNIPKYIPPDHTTNIPVLREVYDPNTKSGKTVQEIVKSSPSLSQKPKFPKLGQGKPLRKKRAEQVVVCEVVDPTTSNVIRYIPASSTSEDNQPVPEIPKYQQPKSSPYVPPDHISNVPVIKEVVQENVRLPKYVPPDHITNVPVVREDTKSTKREGRLPKYVAPDHISHIPVVKEVIDLDGNHM